MRKVPKYVVRKIERANELMQQIVDLNMEVEEWVGRNAPEGSYAHGYGYAVTDGLREARGYEVLDVESYVLAIEQAINE